MRSGKYSYFLARWLRNDSLFFATFAPYCFTEAPAFNYEYCSEQNDGKRHYIKGYCCAHCAAGVMKRLAGREAEEWAEEQAELQAEDLDVTALQKRRLATFGNVPTH
jgi:hypothetical protein